MDSSMLPCKVNSTAVSQLQAVDNVKEKPFSSENKRTHWKNLLSLLVVFMLSASAYQALANLQSSLNYEKGIGLASLSVLYACLMISCLLSPIVIKTLGTKWTIVISLIGIRFYTAANFHPEFYTLLPGAAILGLAAGPFWSAQGTYLTSLAFTYADVVNDVPEVVVQRFNGIFHILYQSSNIWGNLLSSVIFTVNSTVTSLNETELWKCGRNGTGREGMNFDDPGTTKTNILLMTFLAMGCSSVFISIVFMDHIRSDSKSQHSNTRYLLRHFLDVLHVMRTPCFTLLTPLCIYSGYEFAFLSGSFTRSFVSCTVGIHRVGYVMIVFGMSAAISSFGIGRLRAFVSRKIIFGIGGAVNLFVIMWMLLWRGKANVDQGYQFYLMAMGWGFANAVWEVQIPSLLGVLMPKSQEAAFASYRFWQAFGYLLSFSTSVTGKVLVLYKLLSLGVLLLVSLNLYYIMEFMITRKDYSKVECVDTIEKQGNVVSSMYKDVNSS